MQPQVVEDGRSGDREGREGTVHRVVDHGLSHGLKKSAAWLKRRLVSVPHVIKARRAFNAQVLSIRFSHNGHSGRGFPRDVRLPRTPAGSAAGRPGDT